MPAFSFVLSLAAACGKEESADLGAGTETGIDASADADTAGLGGCYSERERPFDAADPHEICAAGMVCAMGDGGELFGYPARCEESDAALVEECGVIGCASPCHCEDVPASECACFFITSTARAKRDVAYVDEATERELRDELLSIRLATYRYRREIGRGDRMHLGFLIEDVPAGSAAVASSERVDLYGFVSMAVATLKTQQRELDALRARIARLEAIG